mmetsp:Transcript_8308/g.23078  ORF Transcript_8308/g.23078 Transcript_8308/m.23078 type:complete len:233 (+) Transcript_8308:1427-2125(+)
MHFVDWLGLEKYELREVTRTHVSNVVFVDANDPHKHRVASGRVLQLAQESNQHSNTIALDFVVAYINIYIATPVVRARCRRLAPNGILKFRSQDAVQPFVGQLTALEVQHHISRGVHSHLTKRIIVFPHGLALQVLLLFQLSLVISINPRAGRTSNCRIEFLRIHVDLSANGDITSVLPSGDTNCQGAGDVRFRDRGAECVCEPPPPIDSGIVVPHLGQTPQLFTSMMFEQT